jgi:hypothetical protein
MSKFGKLDSSDFIKGALVAIFASILASLSAILDAGQLPTVAEWWGIAKVAGSALLGYLTKNLFTNSDGQPLTKESA